MRHDDQSKNRRKLTVTEAYVMAVGGMIGGGIFAVLGLVVDIAGHLAVVAFLVAGTLTFLTGLSYARLYEQLQVTGGGVAFLKSATGRDVLAGHLGWALVVGYVFTISLYAFTFGHYLSNVLDVQAWVAPVTALGIIALLLGINLFGVGKSGLAELVTVWGKLAILGGLALLGLWRFDAVRLQPIVDSAVTSPLVAAAVIFVAFEGFQLLAYDVDDMEDPQRNLRRSMLPAIVTATLVYVLVTIAALMLVSEQQLIDQKEVALASAGREALGSVGLWAITLGALFSTASAINATLFATARLAVFLAGDGQMPEWLGHTSETGVPRRALFLIAVGSAIFAMLGSIDRIVTFASITFLAVFAIVNGVAFVQTDSIRSKTLSGIGAAGLALALGMALFWLATNRLSALLIAGAIALCVGLGRGIFLHRQSSANVTSSASQ